MDDQEHHQCASNEFEVIFQSQKYREKSDAHFYAENILSMKNWNYDPDIYNEKHRTNEKLFRGF